jgi:CheY-like chemotaxis protein
VRCGSRTLIGHARKVRSGPFRRLSRLGLVKAGSGRVRVPAAPAPQPIALVVGRPASDRPAITAALRAFGMEVLELGEADALVQPGPRKPRLLVLDDASATRETRQATQVRLCSHPLLKHVPLLVVANDAAIDGFGGAFSRGAAAFLQKPLDTSELTAIASRLAAWPAATVIRTNQAPRRPLILAVDIEMADAAVRRGWIVEASATGCRLEMLEPVTIGTRLGIVPRWGDASTEIRLGGTVLWSRPTAGNRHLLGVRWRAMGAALAAKMLGLSPRPAAPSAGT